jgi:hypothetical protein
LRYSEKPEVNAFPAQFTTRCYNSLLVNEFWRSGPGARRCARAQNTAARHTRNGPERYNIAVL